MSTYVVAAAFAIALGVLGVAGVALVGVAGRGTRWGRVGALVALGAVGVLLGVMGSLMQGWTVRIGGSGSAGLMDASSGAAPGGPGGVAFPLGAVCSLLAFAGLLYVGARVFRAPIGVCIPALGWIIAVGALTYGTSEGDVVLASTVAAQIFVYGGLVVAAGVLVFAYQWQLSDRLQPAGR
jgi:hypothetical protein